MDKVYLVYNDFGYDGIRVEAICTTFEKAREAAVIADVLQTETIVIEEWDVDAVSRTSKPYWMYTNGKVK